MAGVTFVTGILSDEVKSLNMVCGARGRGITRQLPVAAGDLPQMATRVQLRVNFECYRELSAG